MSRFVLLDVGTPHLVEAIVVDGEYWILASDVETILGWQVRPEGLCNDDVCIPLTGRGDLIDGDRISLGNLAERIERPIAFSREEAAAYLGQPFQAHGESVGHLDAPDFSLPALDGRTHTLSEHRGSKVLLAAWASW